MTAKGNHHDRRLQTTQARLNDALDRLRKGCPVHPLHQRGYTLSVATLAREAGVARNTIYTSHRHTLDDLQMMVGDPVKPTANRRDKLDELQALIETMKQEERRLVSENAQLLHRALSAEAEADRHRRHNARLIAERNNVLRTVPANRTVSLDEEPEN